MKILVLGASGFVGRNIYEYFRDKGYSIDAPSHKNLDVLNEDNVRQYLEKGNYEVVVNSLDARENDGSYFENRMRMFNNLAR